MAECALCQFLPSSLPRMAAEEALEDLEGIGIVVLGKFPIGCETCGKFVCTKHRFQCALCDGIFCGRHVPTNDHPWAPCTAVGDLRSNVVQEDTYDDGSASDEYAVTGACGSEWRGAAMPPHTSTQHCRKRMREGSFEAGSIPEGADYSPMEDPVGLELDPGTEDDFQSLPAEHEPFIPPPPGWVPNRPPSRLPKHIRRPNGAARRQLPGKSAAFMRTATHFQGQPICKGYNDGRCRVAEHLCHKKFVHCCDFLIHTGTGRDTKRRPCGSKDHTRMYHKNEAQAD